MRRTLRFALALAALAIATGPAEAQEATSGIFEGHGIVKAVAPGTGVLTLAHDDIKGFMPAMEMMYRVETPELSKDLHPGDEVDFRIDAKKLVIVDVKRVDSTK